MTNATFVKGLVVCAALMLAFGGAIALLNGGTSRPEGVAEDWLTAIGDTTRKGVEADATRRADKVGPPEFATKILHGDAEAIKREAGFETLEVGKAVRVNEASGDAVRVGYRVDARRPEDQTVEIKGVITLEKQNDEWIVTALDVVDPVSVGVPELPSDGGPPPSSAPLSLWIGALVGAAVIGVITSSVVRAASRTTAAHAAVA